MVAEAARAEACTAEPCDLAHAGVQAPGSMAVWVFIYAELVEFGLCFLGFLIARHHFPADFYLGPPQLNTLSGFLNTLVLLSSSFCMVRAIRSIKGGHARRCVHWLMLTVLAGVTYCLIKGWEYQWNERMGISSRSNYFFAAYYYLTFNHLLHVIIGTCTVMSVALMTAFGFFTAEDHEGLEGAASYWHMIDLVWILIFPLIYVLR